MARAALKENEDYISFCWNNDYITKNNQIRFTAEILYRWIIQNTDFIESHTGLEDVKIERKIFEYLVNNYPEINGQLWEDNNKMSNFEKEVALYLDDNSTNFVYLDPYYYDWLCATYGEDRVKNELNKIYKKKN